MKVGYLGPGKATSDLLPQKSSSRVNPMLNLCHFQVIPKICRAVGDEEIDFGVVAAENVIEGVVTENYLRHR